MYFQIELNRFAFKIHYTEEDVQFVTFVNPILQPLGEENESQLLELVGHKRGKNEVMEINDTI